MSRTLPARFRHSLAVLGPLGALCAAGALALNTLACGKSKSSDTAQREHLDERPGDAAASAGRTDGAGEAGTSGGGAGRGSSAGQASSGAPDADASGNGGRSGNSGDTGAAGQAAPAGGAAGSQGGSGGVAGAPESPEGGASAVGGADAAPAAAGTGASDDPLCAGIEGFVELSGQLGDIDGTARRTTACTASLTSTIPSAPDYPAALGYSLVFVPRERVRVMVEGCDIDGESGRLSVGFDFEGESGAPLAFESGFVRYRAAADAAIPDVPLLTLDEDERPLAGWANANSMSADGVGRLYSGSFSAETEDGLLQGRFSVCYVATIDSPIVR